MTGTLAQAEPFDASGYSFAIVAARFNREITESLVAGALECFGRHGVQGPEVFWVPGAFELPLACLELAETERYDAIVALGAVIRGGTPHFQFVAAEAARGMMDAMLDSGVPIAFGVLTTDDEAQARARAGGAEGNKGADAARTAIEMADLLAGIDEETGAVEGAAGAEEYDDDDEAGDDDDDDDEFEEGEEGEDGLA